MCDDRTMRWIAVSIVMVTAVAVAGPDASKPTKASAAKATANAKAANLRGMKRYGAKDYAGAAKEFRAAIEAQPNFVLAHYNLASMAALLDDKSTVLAELRWLHDSGDAAARKALDKAPSDPDLKSMIDDPDVKQLLAPDCSSTCSRELDAEVARCGKDCDSRDCMRPCTVQLDDCTLGCKLGMNATARARMHAWIAGPLRGRDNDMARMRKASIESHPLDPEATRFSATIKNQFGFECALDWNVDGAPATLRACVAADKKWLASPAKIPLKCRLDTRHKVDRCEGSFTLSSDDYHDTGTFVLERALK
jgi:hypothetical protein